MTRLPVAFLPTNPSRPRRGVLPLVAVGLIAAFAPASAAAQGPYWHDASGDLPAAVDLADVVVSDGEVLAVGSGPGDAAAAPSGEGEATDVAAIYRLAPDGAW